jgi:hypothetical protein
MEKAEVTLFQSRRTRTQILWRLEMVYYDTGGGDIYAGKDKEQIEEAIRQECGGDFALSDMFEVDGTQKMSDEDLGDCTLADAAAAHGPDDEAWLIASDNC